MMTKTHGLAAGVILAVLALAIAFQSATQASYWRGIADDASSRLEEQQLVVDSISNVADSLLTELQLADSMIIEQRALAAFEVARLASARDDARARSEQLSASLRASLDSAQAAELDTVVESYEEQIEALESMLEVERELTAAERLRATQATALVASLQAVVVEHEAAAGIMTAEIEALRSAMQPSLGLRIKADWWLAAVGFAAGVALTK
jgi:hypothetical protein